MALGVAKPFPREWMVESVDNRRNHKIPRDQFQNNETGLNSLPERVNCMALGWSDCVIKAGIREILPRVNIEKVDSLPTLVPIKIKKRELESNSRTAIADPPTLDAGSLTSLILYSLALNQIDLAWLHHQATAADNLFLSFFSHPPTLLCGTTTDAH